MSRNSIMLIIGVLLLFAYTGCIRNEKALDAENLIPIYGIREINKDGRYKLVLL